MREKMAIDERASDLTTETQACRALLLYPPDT
jgi:hypothetical protein